MPGSIPPRRANKYCKVCFERTGKKYFMKSLGSRIKCPSCGREVLVGGSRPSSNFLRSVDPVRFRTAGFRFGSARGSGQDRLDTWEAPAPIRKPERRIPHQSVGRFPLESDFDQPYEDEKEYRITGVLPYVKNLEELSYEVINGILTVESLKNNFEFLKEFKLPEDVLVSSLKVTLKNGILEIHFKKKN